MQGPFKYYAIGGREGMPVLFDAGLIVNQPESISFFIKKCFKDEKKNIFLPKKCAGKDIYSRSKLIQIGVRTGSPFNL